MPKMAKKKKGSNLSKNHALVEVDPPKDENDRLEDDKPEDDRPATSYHPSSYLNTLQQYINLI